MSGTSVDGTWDGGGPALDEDAASADKVLEIPQTACTKDGATVPCDGAAADADDSDDDSQAINAPSPGAPPQVFDDDTASAGTPDSDWGSVDDYQNQQLNAVPYAVYPYVVAVPANDEPIAAGWFVRLCADEQPAHAGRDAAAESGPVDESAHDVGVRASGRRSDGDVESVPRLASLTARRRPFLFHRVRALLSVPDRVAIDDARRTGFCHADNG